MALFDISLETANRLYEWGWRASLVGALITAVGVGLLMWGTRVRDHDFESKVAQANLDAANAILQTASLQKDTEQLRGETAAANAKALEAQLALERFKAPRVLTDEQGAAIAEALKPFAGQEFGVTTYWEMKEPLAFANQIFALLGLAGWEFVKPPSPTFLMGGIEGVQVWVHPAADTQVRKAAETLVEALSHAGVTSMLEEQNPQNEKDNKINLNVCTKP